MQKENIYRSENYKGYTVNIEFDDNPQNPRTDWDNLGTMVCWHNRYNLGDMDHGRPISKDYEDSDNLFAEIAGIDIDSAYCQNIYDKQGYRELSKYLFNQASKKAIILPLYLYDHSGITMSTSSFTCQWDSGQVGYIYITIDQAKKEYGFKRLTSAWRKKLVGYLVGEVRTYDDFLTGQVYGFSVIDPSGNEVRACWGYYGYEDGIKDAIYEAKSNIDYDIKDKIAKHLQQVKTWITNKVPLQYRKSLQQDLLAS